MAVDLKQLPAGHQQRSQYDDAEPGRPGFHARKSERHHQYDILQNIQEESWQVVIAERNPTDLRPVRMTLKIGPGKRFGRRHGKG